MIGDLELAGGVAGIVAVALTVAWLGIMIRLPPPRGDAADWLEFYADRERLLHAHFMPSMLIAVAYVPIWIGLGAHLWGTHPHLGILAAAFGLLYVPFAVAGYSLQFTVVRAIAAKTPAQREEWLPIWRVMSFSDAPESATYWMVVLGYALWGLGAAFAAAGLVGGPTGLEVTAGCALGITALLTWVGAAGVISSDPRLKWATVGSGAASVAATGLTSALLLV